jgi:hypothetical protein
MGIRGRGMRFCRGYGRGDGRRRGEGCGCRDEDEGGNGVGEVVRVSKGGSC